MATRIILGTCLLFCTAGSGGCSYGGIATTADGQTIYIARNNDMFFGLTRRIYVCKPTFGNQLSCHVMDGEP